MIDKFRLFIAILIIVFVHYTSKLESANNKITINSYSDVNTHNLARVLEKSMKYLADDSEKETTDKINPGHKIKIQFQPYYFTEKEIINFFKNEKNKDDILPLELVNSSIAISFLARISPSIYSLFIFYEPILGTKQSDLEDEKSEEVFLKQYSIGGGLEMKIKSIKKLHTIIAIGLGYQNNKIDVENSPIKKTELENIFLRTEIGFNIKITETIHLVCMLYNDQVLSMNDNIEIHDMYKKQNNINEEDISLQKSKRGIKIGTKITL